MFKYIADLDVIIGLTLSRMGPNLIAIAVWVDDFQIDGRSTP